MDDTANSARLKRAEQLKRWEESDTNKQPSYPKQASRIKFPSEVVFLAACTAGDKEEVQRLLNLGADINTPNVDGLTALHQACIDDNLDMVEFLVSRGADVNGRDHEGWTPLHATASCGFLSIARYLLENNADVAAVNYEGHLPVDISNIKVKAFLQNAIEEQGIDCEKLKKAEKNALMNDAKYWAKNGYYVEVHDPITGATPLHVAAEKGYLDVAKLLLEECHVDPNCVDYEGWTPLHAAALWGNKEACALLLKQGADPELKNICHQTCEDLVHPRIESWLLDQISTCPAKLKKNLNNNNKPKLSYITGQNDNNVNDVKPPKGRPRSPDTTAEPTDATNNEDLPSWRRTASLRTRQNENKDNNVQTPNKRQHFDIGDEQNEKTSKKSANMKETKEDPNREDNALNAPNQPVKVAQPSVRRPTESADISNNTSTTPQPAATPTKLSPGNIFKNFFKSFVPPVRDDESETQRKAHAKRVRETRRSTQGVTLDELKSAEQLVKKKSGNGTIEKTVTPQNNESEENSSENSSARGGLGSDVAVTLALAPVTATATATIAASAGERRPSWRLRLDPTNKFELEDAGRPSSPSSTGAANTTYNAAPRPPPSGLPTTGVLTSPVNKEKVGIEFTPSSPTPTDAANTTYTITPRPPPSDLPTTSVLTPSPVKEGTEFTPSSPTTTEAAVTTYTVSPRRPPSGPPTSVPVPSSPVNKEKAVPVESEKDRDSTENAQTSSNITLRRRRPKRRSTGVGNVDDIDDIVRGSTGEGEAQPETSQSGSERTTAVDGGGSGEKYYKALYLATLAEVRKLRDLLETTEQQLRDARASNQISLTEQGKREKRTMARKLSEMEEELKQLQKLKAENERLRAENRALTRVVTKIDFTKICE